jgi:hypothetical protein
MRTPNDYLRALLLELAHEAELSDSAIARAHNRAYEDSTLAASSVQRFRDGTIKGTRDAPSELMEEAYAAALGTTRKANWDEAIRRWRAAEKT